MKNTMENLLIKICAIPDAVVIGIKILIVVAGCFIFAFACSLSNKKNHEPDDIISEAICEAAGSKTLRYCGKRYLEPGRLGVSGEFALYEYEILDYEVEIPLTDIIEAANSVIKEKKIIQKIDFDLWEKSTSRAHRSVVHLSNYYVDEDGYEQYESLQILSICGSVVGDSPYNKASTYINLPDIKRLYVTEKVAKDAEENGIDWYDIWPDLEYIKVTEDRY